MAWPWIMDHLIQASLKRESERHSHYTGQSNWGIMGRWVRGCKEEVRSSLLLYFCKWYREQCTAIPGELIDQSYEDSGAETPSRHPSTKPTLGWFNFSQESHKCGGCVYWTTKAKGHCVLLEVIMGLPWVWLLFLLVLLPSWAPLMVLPWGINECQALL